MTEKELRDSIMVLMLKYRDKVNVGINSFCLENKIQFSSEEQKERIFHYFQEIRYIRAQFFLGGDGIFTITSSGIDYAESLKEKAKSDNLKNEENNSNKDNKIDSDKINNQTDENRKDIHSLLFKESYTVIENHKRIKDNTLDPCFGVDELARCFVNLIDSASNSDLNNVCMIGIFAPWGRGKTYFFNRVKDFIEKRSQSASIQYDVVEFNAWKYQETPAIWAYLYEMLYKSRYKLRYKSRYKLIYELRSWRHRTGYTIKRNWKSIICNIFIALIPIIITLALYLIKKIESVWGGVAIGTSVFGLIIYWLQKNYNSAISFMRKYTKKISFANELGVQAEIEKEITSLLKSWIHEKSIDKKKVLLYVDDIDRCSETKMISILESLRTVLENESIRKRLIIICSIDPEKIIKGIEYKYRELYKDEDLHNIAIDQMDKIFLTGIALPPLDHTQLEEFVAKLTQSENKTNPVQQSESPYNLNRSKGKDTPINEEDTINLVLDDSEIEKELTKLIESNLIVLTPRKIRVIYYRILLASNIISINKDVKIRSNIIKDIFDLSIGMNKDVKEKEALTDVINMVVPYHGKNDAETND